MTNPARIVSGLMARLYLCLSLFLIAAGAAVELRWISWAFSGWLAILGGAMLFLYSISRLSRWWHA
jgi:hypothetical protein